MHGGQIIGSAKSIGHKRIIKYMIKNMNYTPFVTVIVPVYNNATQMIKCITALISQTYEIIIVDNGSSDNTPDTIRQFPVTFLTEDNIQSSYAARNKGLRHARGNIVAFTDSDCIPCENWLKEGVTGIQSYNADLVGGSVRFSFSQKPSGSEIWDSITNMQIEQNISTRSVAKTANLFVRKEVFNNVGYFPQDIKSGGDVIFTQKATSMGYKLVYIPLAEIIHPARNLYPLLKKQYRVGIGQASIKIHQNAHKNDYFTKLLYNFIPLSLSKLKTNLMSRSLYTTRIMLLRIWTVGCLSRIMTSVGNMTAIIKTRIYEGDN
jgi:glycosyltransferase involved in cell wall biosynthesis